MQNSLIIPLLVSFNVILALLAVILLIGVIYFRYKYLSLVPAKPVKPVKIATEKVNEAIDKAVTASVKSVKKQKPVANPVISQKVATNLPVSTTIRCGACGKDLSDGQQHYCPAAN